jgi:hypothetical protein
LSGKRKSDWKSGCGYADHPLVRWLSKLSVGNVENQGHRRPDSPPLPAEIVMMSALPARLADFHVARDVLALYWLGSCASAELFANLGSEHLARSVIDAKVRRYVERLERDVLRAVDGDRFSPCAMRIVGRAFR